MSQEEIRRMAAFARVEDTLHRMNVLVLWDRRILASYRCTDFLMLVPAANDMPIIELCHDGGYDL